MSYLDRNPARVAPIGLSTVLWSASTILLLARHFDRNRATSPDRASRVEAQHHRRVALSLRCPVC
jgi:hypothetical protein